MSMLRGFIKIAEALRKAAAGFSLSVGPRRGKPWSEEEDRKLCAHFDEGFTIRQLADWSHRPKGAIRSRLKKLGKR